MKIVGERDEAVHLLLHFQPRRSGVYDRAAVEIMTRVRGGLERSVNLARLLRNDVEAAVAEAALVERSRCAAFVVSGDRRMCEANPLAEKLFIAGQAVAVRNGRCHLADARADARFGAALEKLSKGLPTLASRIAFRTATGAWQVSVATVPFPQSSRRQPYPSSTAPDDAGSRRRSRFERRGRGRSCIACRCLWLDAFGDSLLQAAAFGRVRRRCGRAAWYYPRDCPDQIESHPPEDRYFPASRADAAFDQSWLIKGKALTRSALALPVNSPRRAPPRLSGGERKPRFRPSRPCRPCSGLWP